MISKILSLIWSIFKMNQYLIQFVSQFFMFQNLQRENIKVCQVGEGADELFFGYTNWFRTSKINMLINNIFFPDFLKKLILFLYKKLNFQYKYTSDFLEDQLKKNLYSGVELKLLVA